MTTIYCIRSKRFNIGNDAVNLGLRYFIDRAFNNEVNLICLPASSYDGGEKNFGLTAKAVHEINQTGHGVIVGGGNLLENGELYIDANALNALEAPLMVFSISKGKIYNRCGELVERTDHTPDANTAALCSKAKYVLARDQATLKYLQGIGAKHCILGGCPTVYLNEIVGQRDNLPDNLKGLTLISIRNPQLMNIPLKKQFSVCEDLQKIIVFLKKKGHTQIKLLCHDKRDVAFAASLPTVDYIYTEDVYTYLSLLKYARINITYRLHSAIPCFSFGTPVISVSYDERAQSLMETLGLGRWDINLMQTQNVVEEISNYYHQLTNLNQVVEQAQKKWTVYHKICSDTFDSFAQDVRDYQFRILSNG